MDLVRWRDSYFQPPKTPNTPKEFFTKRERDQVYKEEKREREKENKLRMENGELRMSGEK